MRIAIASGKGGTGKTTVATNLAHVAARSGRSVAYLDCDVEEPNGHIFLCPQVHETRSIDKPIPVIDQDRCSHCGACSRICRFGAIASLPKKTLVYPELCHACGGCELVCPCDAIQEVPRSIGTLRLGTSGRIRFVDGTLNIGEAMSPPAIHAVKAAAPECDLVLLDAPPGTSCPAIEAIRGSDFVILVTEPTPFGLHDLTLAIDMVRALGLPMGVVVNRAGIADEGVLQYCTGHRVAVLGEIPDDRNVAEAYSRGAVVADAVPSFARHIGDLLERIDYGVPT
jgi:MinD superfamily P-loop ATPase